jgi:branched-subunit amino acid ABC-type transport system permease component
LDFATIILLHIFYAIASLTLMSLGLAVIFGMMRVINFAHGEFLMMGGYAFVLSAKAGLNIWLAMLVVAPAVVAAFSVLVERVIIRHLYGRLIETVLATWGLSLILIGLASSIFGYLQRGVAPPFGSFAIGVYREGGYSLFVILITVAMALSTYCFLRSSRFGLQARATMQNPLMAASLGVDTDRVYALTFGIGGALAGLAGAVLAPIAGVVPIVGATYVAKSFITVIAGGSIALVGTSAAATLLGTISQLTSNVSTPVVGEVALLLAAIILLRVLPEGITGRFFRGGL